MQLIEQSSTIYHDDPKLMIPYDPSDPFIFHSLGRKVDFETAVRLLKNDAALSPLNRTHTHVGFSRYPLFLDTPEANRITAAWGQSGVEGRGIIYAVDSIAGDNRYVFTTPGYAHSTSQVTFAFRYSTVKSFANAFFRCEDIIERYTDLLVEVEDRFGVSRKVTDLKDPRNMFSPDGAPALKELTDRLKGLAAISTLSKEDSAVVIPDYNVARYERTPLSEKSLRLILDHLRKYESDKSSQANNIRQMWISYVRGVGGVLAETLLDNIIPLRAAEYVLEPTRRTWHPVNSFLSTPLSGLGRTLLRPNRRLLIPASRQR
jgi:hypothetical protein